jgi:hypothetical protein
MEIAEGLAARDYYFKLTLVAGNDAKVVTEVHPMHLF